MTMMKMNVLYFVLYLVFTSCSLTSCRVFVGRITTPTKSYCHTPGSGERRIWTNSWCQKRIETALNIRAGEILASTTYTSEPASLPTTESSSSTEHSKPTSSTRNKQQLQQREQTWKRSSDAFAFPLIWLIPGVTAAVGFCFYDVVQGLVGSHISHIKTGLTERTPTGQLSESSQLVLLTATQAIATTLVHLGHMTLTVLSMLFTVLTGSALVQLQNRRQAVRSSIIREVHLLRQLQALARSSLFRLSFFKTEQVVILDCIDLFLNSVKQECLRPRRRPGGRGRGHGTTKLDSHKYIESDPGRLLTVCDQIEVNARQQQQHQTQPPQNENERHRAVVVEPFLTKIRDLVQQAREERLNRWVSIVEMQVPRGYFLTIGLLATSILFTFLCVPTLGKPAMAVARAEKQRLPSSHPRILWSLLATWFSVVGVLCVELTDAFSGTVCPTGTE